MINEAIRNAVEKKDLPFALAKDAMNYIMGGDATDAQIAAFIIALRMKGETVDEITAFAEVMREKAVKITPKSEDLLDTCGTGGDSSGSFNISTAVAFVAASAGVKVAKHGNRSVSSKCGSADVLEELGVNLEIAPEKVAEGIDEVGIGFLYAPLLHNAMKYAIGPRKEIGLRTVFNILGPLTNPAGASYQLLGVFDPSLVKVLADVLKNLGSKRAVVVHGNGFDEITVTGVSNLAILTDGKITYQEILPEKYGIKIAKKEDLDGGSAKQNAEIINNVLSGKEKGPKTDVVVINSAAALFAAAKVKDINEGVELASQIISSGSPYDKLKQFIKFTNK